jgi:hypothetical protein
MDDSVLGGSCIGEFVLGVEIPGTGGTITYHWTLTVNI